VRGQRPRTTIPAIDHEVFETRCGHSLIVAKQASGVQVRPFAVGETVNATFAPEGAIVLHDSI
jgi:hypothetical protein